MPRQWIIYQIFKSLWNIKYWFNACWYHCYGSPSKCSKIRWYVHRCITNTHTGRILASKILNSQHHHLNRVSNHVPIKSEIKEKNGHETYYGWHVYGHLLSHPSQKLGCQPTITKNPLKCNEWYQNYLRKILLRTKPITIEAKNNVAETVVAPFPLVATWRKTFRNIGAEQSMHWLIEVQKSK